MKEDYEKWVDNFYKGIFNRESESEEYKKWMLDKINKLPHSLYQYTRVKYAYNLLNKNLMFINQFNKLNDPFEANFLHDEELYKKRGEILEVDERYKELYRVACFTKDNDNTPMWAFYGDNHQGICIEYDFHEDEKFRDLCLPVQYVDETNNTNLAEIFLDGKDPQNRLILELFVKKSKTWNYEKEWRLIFYDNYQYNDFEFKWIDDKKYLEFLKPKAVYMGLKITCKDENYIRDLCKSNNIKVYKMTEDRTGYNLIPKKVL